jgi:hypothetical protein
VARLSKSAFGELNLIREDRAHGVPIGAEFVRLQVVAMRKAGFVARFFCAQSTYNALFSTGRRVYSRRSDRARKAAKREEGVPLGNGILSANLPNKELMRFIRPNL